jgi:antitoxin (DNA-binding transcriptional repressor) of toxin-antitoxin stability system
MEIQRNRPNPEHHIRNISDTKRSGSETQLPTLRRINDLPRSTRRIVERLERSGEPVVITRHGKLIAALVPVDEAMAVQLALSLAPEFVEGRRRANQELKDGKTRPLNEVIAEMESAK